jgi:hypothetical protein
LALPIGAFLAASAQAADTATLECIIGAVPAAPPRVGIANPICSV